MEDVDKAVTAVGEEELCRRVMRDEEHQLLDYKAPMEWNEKSPDCISLVKDILALANSGGGYIVIGVSETNGGFEFDGLNGAELETWETTRLGNTVRNYADPHVSLRVRKPECDGKRFAVITVDGFRRTPHICKKDYERGGKTILSVPSLYVRTVTCESRPFQSADELSEVIDRAARTRQDEMLTGIRSILQGASTPTSEDARVAFEAQVDECLQEMSLASPDAPFDGVFTDVMFPARFEEDRFSRSQLSDAIKAASKGYSEGEILPFEGWSSEIVSLADGLRLEFSKSSKVGGDDFVSFYRYWRMRRSGLLVARSLSWEVERLGLQGQRILYKRSVAVHIAQSIDILVNLYTALGLSDEDVTWRFEFSGARDRILMDPPNILPYPGYRPQAKVETVSYKRTLSMEEWRAGQVDHTVAAIRDIYEQWGATFIRDGDIAHEVRTYLGLA